MNNFFVVDPTRVFETGSGGNSQVQELRTMPLAASVASNTQVIAGVAGKRIRVMGLIASHAATGKPVITFKSASGGSTLAVFTLPDFDEHPFVLPITPSGYWFTATGEGLFVDVTNVATDLVVFYIFHDPPAA